MKTLNFFGILVAVLALAVSAPAQTPPLPSTPAGVDLVYAEPFILQQGYQSNWSKENPTVTSGYLIVVRVDHDLVFPRQVAEPVLYAGNQTAERINVGYISGHVVGIVTGPLDPARDPIWFGTPQLPEQVSSNTVQSERQRAVAAGIRATSPAFLRSALRSEIVLADRAALLRHAADLIRQYSPDEGELADNLTPVSK